MTLQPMSPDEASTHQTTLYPIPPGPYCVPSAIVAITGADIESVVHPAINRHDRHYGLLDLVVGVSIPVVTAVLTELGYRVRPYRRDGTAGKLRAHVATWAERSKRWPGKPVLLSTRSHMMVAMDGRVYDNWQPHGPQGADHPFARTVVTWAALVEKE